MDEWLLPLGYGYLRNAMWVSALVGAVCGFLSCFLMLKGWSLIGDALSHSVVPGVVIAWSLQLPLALGAFVSATLAAAAMLLIGSLSRLKQDAVIGLVFTSFFGLGLFIASVSPTPINVNRIIYGNILAITPADTAQLLGIAAMSMALLLLRWRDLMLVFFDEHQAWTVGLRPDRLRAVFFLLLAACTVAAMMTVGAFLVVAMVIVPGATAYLLSDRFGRVLSLSVLIGALSGALGVYISYFLDGAPGGVIVLLQGTGFAVAFLFAPRHGLLAVRRRRAPGGAS